MIIYNMTHQIFVSPMKVLLWDLSVYANFQRLAGVAQLARVQPCQG